MVFKLIVALLATCLFIPPALGEEKKNGHIGVASFATVISYDLAGVRDDELGGLGVYGGAAFNDNFGIRGLIGFQSHQDFDIDVLATELTLQAGTGLATKGFKAFGSAGLYSESWDFGSGSERFSGGLFGGGIGYNWPPVSLEFWMHFRSTSDYEDAVGLSSTAASGGLGLSGRF